jgi:hypothetical protein
MGPKVLGLDVKLQYKPSPAGLKTGSVHWPRFLTTIEVIGAPVRFKRAPANKESVGNLRNRVEIGRGNVECATSAPVSNLDPKRPYSGGKCGSDDDWTRGIGALGQSTVPKIRADFHWEATFSATLEGRQDNCYF